MIFFDSYRYSKLPFTRFIKFLIEKKNRFYSRAKKQHALWTKFSTHKIHTNHKKQRLPPIIGRDLEVETSHPIVLSEL